MIAGFNDLIITRWGARFQGRKFPCAIGRGGIGEKTGEGDGKTPKGKFSIIECGFRNDRVFFHAPAVKAAPIALNDVWSDDPTDPHYNHKGNLLSHRYSHEKLRRADPLYDAYVVLNFNYPKPIAGKGSAIFLHVWRKPRHPTEGCVAFAEHDLLNILENWTDKSQIIIR